MYLEATLKGYILHIEEKKWIGKPHAGTESIVNHRGKEFVMAFPQW